MNIDVGGRRKKVILFGAGRYGRIFVEKNGDFIQDTFLFCNNDSSREGEDYVGLQIVSFSEIRQLYKDKEIARIIITTARAMEILEQLVLNGMANANIYFYDMEANAIKPVKDIYSQTVFSQEGEELHLAEKFANKKGLYVDVGALHPFRFSNTAWAYKKGWRGINIEPNVDHFHLFELFRPKDININCGIANQEGELTYYCFEEPGLNGFDMEAHKDIPIVEKRKVAVRKLSDILREHRISRIDFLDVDVEGFEMEVLRSIDFSVDIECILLEQHMCAEFLSKSAEFIFLKEKGYEAIAKYGRTTVYEKRYQ